MKYSEIQSHRDSYPIGSYEEIVTNSKQKGFDYMKDKSKEGLDYIAMTYFGNTVSYTDMFNEIEKYAKALKNYGIGKGDFVTLLLPNIPEMVYIKYALNRIGAIPNMIDPRTNPERILSYINEAKSKLVVSSLELVGSKIEPIKKQVKVDNILVIPAANSMSLQATNDAKESMAYFLLKYKEFIFKLQEKLKREGKYITDDDFIKQYGGYFTGILDTIYEEEEPFAVYYTSGSSGKPKGVLASNEAYNAMVEQMTFGADATKYQKGETFLGIIPFFSSYGSLSGMHNSLCRNWNIQMIPKFNPNEFDLLLTKYKPNNALGVPRFWETLIKEHRVDDVHFSFLSRPVTGGDRITLKSIEEINEFFRTHGVSNPKLKVGYGASEFGGCVSATLEDFGDYNPQSSGILLLGCRGMVVNPETLDELNVGEAGEICISSPTQMIGYLNNEEETKEITVYDKEGNKYYRTGDKGYIDEKGNLYIIDRYKRAMMRPDGHTVHAGPIEETIMQDDRIDNCCVVGLKRENVTGDIPTAFIKLKDNRADFKDIVDEVDEYSLIKLPERERALAYVQVPEMQFTLMGKVDYRYYEKFLFDDVEAILKDYAFFPERKGKVLKRNLNK